LRIEERPRRAGVNELQVIERCALVKFSPAQMFALVDDVARYPEFLPWCVGAHVERSSMERLATIKVHRGVLRMQLTTRNTVAPDSQILMELVEGPFSELHGRWTFDAIGERGSQVRFRLAFAFKSRLMAALLSPVFESLCADIVDAFTVRARAVYREAV
jgi:ribosome-associated toxin RatA of RatAB toxin-antitoxin module